MKAYLWFNAIGFQGVWWSCVVSHNIYWGLPAVFVALLFLAIHFYCVESKLKELKLMAWVFLMAMLGEVLVNILGIYHFSDAWNIPLLPPLWLMALWLAFSCTLNHALAMIVKRPKLAVMVAMVMGPLTYLSGQRFGVLIFNQSFGALAMFSVVWGIYMSLIIFIRKRV